ncbi:MAG: zinc metallopeptidase [Clostridia bacterium]
MYGYYGFYWDEPWVVVLLLIATAFAGYAQLKVSSSFKKYSDVRSSRNITGAEAAMQVLRNNGITDVSVERISGNLTDHFDPTSNVIRLSDSVYDKTSVAAIGVAAHEAGHAVQYAQGYAPMSLRAAIIPVANLGTTIAFPLIIAGMFFGAFLTNLGIILFSMTAVFQFVTLPVEFDASNRALVALESGHILSDEEMTGAKKVLSAAAMTYVAALAMSIVQVIRLVVRYGGRSND